MKDVYECSIFNYTKELLLQCVVIELLQYSIISLSTKRFAITGYVVCQQ